MTELSDGIKAKARKQARASLGAKHGRSLYLRGCICRAISDDALIATCFGASSDRVSFWKFQHSNGGTEAATCQHFAQIEFYFSDSNLPRDSFLLSAVEEAPDGYVSLGLICTFSRIRQLLKLGGEDAKLAAADVSMT